MDDYRKYLLKPLEDLIRLFDDLNIPYAIMGGMAVSVHGIPRPTHDLDFTISVDRKRLNALYSAAVNLGYTTPEAYQSGWVDQVSDLPLVRMRQWIDGKTVDIDLFLVESEFQESVLTRRMECLVEGRPAWVVSPEDLILLKLIAGRPRDLGDIQDILMVQGQLDSNYLDMWSERLGVKKLLNEAMKLYDDLK